MGALGASDVICLGAIAMQREAKAPLMSSLPD